MALGIVLLAHGSRDPQWCEPMQAVAAQMAQDAPGLLVRCAYLELAQPDLQTAADELVQQGATALRVLPLFLGLGRHVREDLPRLVANVQDRHPDVPVSLQPAVGQHPRLIETLARIALGDETDIISSSSH